MVMNMRERLPIMNLMLYAMYMDITALVKQSKVAIVSVFQNVFNEMQGFSGSNPFLADLERKLAEDGKYDLFKTKFPIFVSILGIRHCFFNV